MVYKDLKKLARINFKCHYLIHTCVIHITRTHSKEYHFKFNEIINGCNVSFAVGYDGQVVKRGGFSPVRTRVRIPAFSFLFFALYEILTLIMNK